MADYWSFCFVRFAESFGCTVFLGFAHCNYGFNRGAFNRGNRSLHQF